MYHAVEQTLTRAEDEDYTVGRDQFVRHLAILAAAGTRVLSLSEFLRAAAGPGPRVLITFDDGYESVLTVAAPAMAERGFPGVCFVVSDRVGKEGSLTAAQLRQLEATGIAIGAHGQTHRYLSDLSVSDLRGELRASRARLEDALGHSVTTLSAPGGRFDARVLQEAREAGYEAFFSSRPGYARASDFAGDIPRIAVTEAMTDTRLESLARNERRAMMAPRARYAILSIPKRLLGNRGYERVRSAVLRRGTDVTGSPFGRGGASS